MFSCEEELTELLRGRDVWIIDSHSLIYQVFHAMPEMSSPKGEPVSAVYGFTRDILMLLENKKPDFLYCAFDLPGGTFRHERYSDYKKDRGSMPEDLVPQISSIRRVLESLDIPIIAYDAYEADDILATMARICDQAKANCYLVTSDKDCRQLITDSVKMYSIRKDLVYDASHLKEDWGIRPDQVVDFQSLVGDKVDNVPGVPLIGPKIAAELLNKFDTLDDVLDHADEVAGKKRSENIRNGREVALLSRELVRLENQVPVEIDWPAGRVGGFDQQRVAERFAEYGFNTLATQALGMDQASAPSDWEATYRCLESLDDLQGVLDAIRSAGRMSFDIETTNVMPRWAEPVGFALAIDEAEAWYAPVRAPEGEDVLDSSQTIELLRSVLEDPSISVIGQNLKYDMIVMRNLGVEVRGVEFDTMIASYLIDAGGRNHNLDALAKRYLNHTTTKISELIGTGKHQKRMDEVPLEQVVPYAAEDADVPLRLMPILAEGLEVRGLDSLFSELELPLIDVLVEMEFNGIKVDVARLKALSNEFAIELERLQDEIFMLAGHEFNIASPKQLAKVLFEEQNLPVLKKTKTGASTDAGVLEELAHQHDLPAKVIEFRQYSKLKGTYVDALPALVHPETGRIHASFNQVVAATGRLSSSDPNLQNIPIRTEAGRSIRSAFLPGEPDWQLLAADYSQIELRVLAHVSGDETLQQAFLRDEDIHTQVASQVFGVDADQVDSEMRRTAKAVNFGIIYGQSPYGLARQLGIGQDEAAEFIDAYFARYRRVNGFMEDTLALCVTRGYVSTLAGRRREIQGVRRDSNVRQMNLGERTAVNTVVQGSAADLMKMAMIRVYRRLRAEECRSRLLLQIHDELVLEVAPDEIDAVTRLVREEMSAAYELTVPLKVDIKVGANWAEV